MFIKYVESAFKCPLLSIKDEEYELRYTDYVLF
jgi:hypothetical protein